MRTLAWALLSLSLVALTYGWCDPGQFQCQKGTGIGCQTYDCLCLQGWRTTFPTSANCEPICGDNQIVGNEECDGGIGCCGCKCREGYVPTNPPSKDCEQSPVVPICPPIEAPSAQPVSEPVEPVEPISIPVSEPVTSEPIAAPVSEPVSEPVTAPVAEPGSEPVAEPISEPVTSPVSVPVSEPISEPVSEPVTVPITAPVSEPIAEPVTVPVTPPVTAPISVPVTVPVSVPISVPQGQCMYRTYTQGGWGAAPNGNNPGQYLQDNFAVCSRGTVTIGESCNYATFNSSAAIESFLPSGGRPQQIQGKYVNPTNDQVPGVLAGQLLAALLNVGFDTCDANFSTCDTRTADLCFLNGDCSGYTVRMVVNAAQYIVSGCSGCTASNLPSALCNLSLSQMSQCLQTFNEAFDNGKASSTNVGTCVAVESSKNYSQDAPNNANILVHSTALLLSMFFVLG